MLAVIVAIGSVRVHILKGSGCRTVLGLTGQWSQSAVRCVPTAI